MELTKQQRLALSKICIESSKSAGDALKQMINKKVTVTFPNVELREITESEEVNSAHIVVKSKISGDISGEMIFAYPIKKGLQLIDLLMLQEVNTNTEVNDDAKSAFTEFVNIVGGIFLSKMADLLEYEILPNPPIFSLDTQFNNTTLPKLKKSGDLFMIDTFLDVETVGVGGEFFIVFDSGSLEKIMGALDKYATQAKPKEAIVDAYKEPTQGGV